MERENGGRGGVEDDTDADKDRYQRMKERMRRR